ncbi:MAG TPA: chemotaxis protein CheW [Methylomirabilota bacterium]|nr:chemotaxis protein CheW [Methylomirabilota bacterium]
MNNQTIEPRVESQDEQHTNMKQIVVFVLDDEEYGLSITDIYEVVTLQKITPVPNSPEFILGVINLRGKIVPVLDLEKGFHLQRVTKIAPQHIIITENEKKVLFGVQVDRVTEVLKVSEDQIKPAPKLVTTKIAADYIKGVVVLGEAKESESSARILLLLDLQKMLGDNIANQVAAVSQNEGGTITT